MYNLTKKQRKHLHKLAGKAHEAELSSLLDALHAKFAEWQSGEISAWELSDLIHEFHDGDVRKIYKFYMYSKDYEYQVAYAVKTGLLSIDDVEESCRKNVQYHIERQYDIEDDAE